MTIRIAAATAVFAAVAFSGPAFAQANVMKECGAQYQTAKAGNALAGKTWNQYLAECRTRVSATPAAATAPAAPAATAAPAANPLKPVAVAPAAPAAPVVAAKPAAPAATPTAAPAGGGKAAMIARERECGAEWKAQKVELIKATPGLKWPQYWSACNTRLKAAGK